MSKKMAERKVVPVDNAAKANAKKRIPDTLKDIVDGELVPVDDAQAVQADKNMPAAPKEAAYAVQSNAVLADNAPADKNAPDIPDGAADVIQEPELEPSKLIRKIKFVNAIALVVRCEREMARLSIDIGKTEKEIIRLQTKAGEDGARLTGLRAEHEQAQKVNKYLDAKLGSISAEIAAKEMEAKSINSATEEMRKVQAIAKEKLGKFVKNAADLTKASDGTIAQFMALHSKSMKEISGLMAKKKELEDGAAAKRETEAHFGEQVTELEEEMELNAELLAKQQGALSFLNAKKRERQNDIEIILKKSGFGEIRSLAIKAQQSLTEEQDRHKRAVEKATKAIAEEQEKSRRTAEKANNAIHDTNSIADTNIKERDAKIEKLMADLETADAEVAERDSAIAKLRAGVEITNGIIYDNKQKADAEVAERDSAIANLRVDLEKANVEIAERDVTIAERDASIAYLKTTVQGLEGLQGQAAGQENKNKAPPPPPPA